MTLKPASIRARLIWLMLALWLPAVAGLGLQSRSAYLSEERAARDEMRQQAYALAFAVDAELTRRHSVARAFASLPSLRERNLARFDYTVRQAVRDSGDEVVLVDRTHVLLHTALPAGAPPVARKDATFTEGAPAISFVPESVVDGKASMAVLVPEVGTQPPSLNVGVAFTTTAVQQLIQQQRYREGATVSVIDAQQRVMARNRDPERWIGRQASNTPLRQLAQRGGSGFIRTVTLDGVAALTFLAPPGRHGWAAIVALPESTLQAAAWRVALPAIAVSALLLALGLVLALAAARRIARPVLALEQAAGELVAQRIPEPLRTGLAEIDQVGAVLNDAGMRARAAEQVLETRVSEAVADARMAEARLFEARKHEAIGRLTGGVAHDFNNLLQTISMGLQVIQRAVPEGRHTKPLQAALAACGKAADLVRQMLAFGRAQQLQPQAVDVADLLLRSQDLTGKALGERIQLAAELAPDLPPVLADPTQLELALLNLVFNARDAMPTGGKVTVRAAGVDGRAHGLDDRAYVRIDVQDTGHGMDAETLARVFEPYFTTKPVGAGSGLGLPQVLAFSRQSGGDARITSAPGEGTCVTMLLPVSLMGVREERPQAAPTRRSSRALRILMVEDDVLVASVVPPALEHEGHQVTLCRTADEARTLLVQGFDADVLFTDVVMPGSMTGLELVDWCRTHRPELQTLVATGYTARPPQGVWKLLRKPYVIEDLLDALDAATAGQAPAGHA